MFKVITEFECEFHRMIAPRNIYASSQQFITRIFVSWLQLTYWGRSGWRSISGVVKKNADNNALTLKNRCPSALLPLLFSGQSWTRYTAGHWTRYIRRNTQCLCVYISSSAEADVGVTGGLRYNRCYGPWNRQCMKMCTSGHFSPWTLFPDNCGKKI